MLFVIGHFGFERSNVRCERVDLFVSLLRAADLLLQDGQLFGFTIHLLFDLLGICLRLVVFVNLAQIGVQHREAFFDFSQLFIIILQAAFIGFVDAPERFHGFGNRQLTPLGFVYQQIFAAVVGAENAADILLYTFARVVKSAL